MNRQPVAKRAGIALWAIAASAISFPAFAQTVFLCSENGRSFVASGAGSPPEGCRALVDPVGELLLSPAQPDIDALARDLAALSRRVADLEALLLRRPRPRASPLAPTARPDPFDTRGRTRDLGQDIDRRLDNLGR